MLCNLFHNRTNNIIQFFFWIVGILEMCAFVIRKRKSPSRHCILKSFVPCRCPGYIANKWHHSSPALLLFRLFHWTLSASFVFVLISSLCLTSMFSTLEKWRREKFPTPRSILKKIFYNLGSFRCPFLLFFWSSVGHNLLWHSGCCAFFEFFIKHDAPELWWKNVLSNILNSTISLNI